MQQFGFPKMAYLWREFVSSGSDWNQISVVVAECTPLRPLQLILLWT